MINHNNNIVDVKAGNNKIAGVYSQNKLVWSKYTSLSTDSNLKSLVRFNETSGTVVDDSIVAANGTVFGGATWVSGVRGNAISLNGTDSNFVSFGTRGELNRGLGSISFGCYIKPTSLKDHQFICGISRYTTGLTMPLSTWDISLIGGKITLRYGRGGASNLTIFSDDTDRIIAGEWQHITVIFGDGLNSNVKFLINGHLVKSFTTKVITGSDFYASARYLIGGISQSGGDSTPTGKNFHGLIDECFVFNKAINLIELDTIITKGL